jgi:N-acyl-D-amino-acid deacylase
LVFGASACTWRCAGEKVQDTSTYKDPHHYATDIPYVLVHGIPVIMNGEHTGAKAGQALRHVCAPR